MAAASPTPALLDELSEVALTMGAGAAKILSAGFGEDHDIDTKSSATDMVSEVDHNSEAYIAEYLTTHRPADGLLGEESGSKEGTSGVRWVVDPLDGTTNFLFGVPQWCVSIAAEIDERPVVGVVVDPSRDETWHAVLGRGATCNGRPCRPAFGRSELSTALVGTGFGYLASRRAWQAETVARILPKVRDIRRFGSAALDLCWVAGGRFDAYYEWGLNAWDLSAGRLVCTEAGLRVGTSANGVVTACAPELEGAFLGLLKETGVFSEPESPPKP